MCQQSSRIEYSPRRLVWSAAGETGGTGGESAGGGAGPEPGGEFTGRRPEPDLTPGAPARNWRQPMPLGRKIRIAAKNIGIKIRTHQTCCGNYGEPGC